MASALFASEQTVALDRRTLEMCAFTRGTCAYRPDRLLSGGPGGWECHPPM